MSTDPADDTKEYACLVRVTDGKEANFSTKVCALFSLLQLNQPYPQVESGHLEQFHTTYGNILKSSMSPLLRKRDKKREKQRAEETLRRKRRLAEDIIVEGAKRGNGRRKRQRLLKRAIKQEESRNRVHEREQARLSKAKP